MITKNEAMEKLDTILTGCIPGQNVLWDTLFMARDALRVYEPGTENECEACKVHYEDDLK